MAARRIGAGSPVLVLNGYAATAADWDPTFLQALSESHELILADHPGLGERTNEDSPESIEDLARAALGVLDAEGAPSAAVLGWSMGGFVAQALARLAPERVERLVLLSTDPGAGAELCEPAVWSELTDHSGTPEEQAGRLLGLLFPDEFAAALSPEVLEIVATARAALPEATLSAQERAMDAWHEGAEDAQPRVATLAAAGTEDRVIPAGNSARIAAGVEGSWLARFAGGGHAFMAQQPERSVGLITAFLAEPR